MITLLLALALLPCQEKEERKIVFGTIDLVDKQPSKDHRCFVLQVAGNPNGVYVPNAAARAVEDLSGRRVEAHLTFDIALEVWLIGPVHELESEKCDLVIRGKATWGRWDPNETNLRVGVLAGDELVEVFEGKGTGEYAATVRPRRTEKELWYSLVFWRDAEGDGKPNEGSERRSGKFRLSKSGWIDKKGNDVQSPVNFNIEGR